MTAVNKLPSCTLLIHESLVSDKQYAYRDLEMMFLQKHRPETSKLKILAKIAEIDGRISNNSIGI